MVEWRELENFPMYLIYNDGNIFSKKGRRFLKQSKNQNGYIQYGLRDNTGKNIRWYAHQLVYKAFIDSDYDNKSRSIVLDHIDSDISNNLPSNLRLISQRENTSRERSNKRDLPTCVYRCDSHFYSSISITDENAKYGRYSLGTYSCPQTTRFVYLEAVRCVNEGDSTFISKDKGKEFRVKYKHLKGVYNYEG